MQYAMMKDLETGEVYAVEVDSSDSEEFDRPECIGGSHAQSAAQAVEMWTTKPEATDDDYLALVTFGEDGLKQRGLFGVIDRLTNSGKL